MTSDNRGFKGVWIPADIWTNEGLSLQEKCLYVEIDSLSKNDTGCFASNAHFARFLGISVDRVSRVISGLVAKGYVTSIVDNAKGNVRILRTLSLETPIGGYRRKQLDPIVGNTNTLSVKTPCPTTNNTVSNTINNTVRTGERPQKKISDSEIKTEAKSPPSSARPPLYFLDAFKTVEEFEGAMVGYEMYDLKYYYGRGANWKNGTVENSDWKGVMERWIIEDSNKGKAKYKLIKQSAVQEAANKIANEYGLNNQQAVSRTAMYGKLAKKYGNDHL